MGCCCSRSHKFLQEGGDEPEIAIGNYSSNLDKKFGKIEVKYNYLKEIFFNHYMYSLVHFSLENATLIDNYPSKLEVYSSKDAFYSEEFDLDLSQSFLENKILKHPKLYVKAAEEEIPTKTFKQLISLVNKGIIAKFKKIGIEEESVFVLRKSHAVAIGMMFCGGSNISKIRILFNLFAEEKKIKKSKEFSEFLLTLFIVSSYCLFHARNLITDMNSEFDELDDKTRRGIIDTLEMKDSMNLVKVFEKKYLNNGESYNYDQFKKLFYKSTEDNIGWLLCPKGIRYMQEKYNI